jgi:protein phosphatase
VREGRIQQLTRDHSLINDALEIKPDLTDADLARLPKNIITRALGMKDIVKVDVRTEKVEPGDIFLLCSDGLSGMIDDPRLLEVVKGAENLEAAVASLIDAANQAGGTDNITVLALQCLNGTNP